QPRLRLAAAATARMVLADQRAEPVGPVGGDQLEPLRRVAGEELLHRLLACLQREAGRLALVQHAVLRIDAGRHRMRAQEARAEAVDSRHPGALGLARQRALAELGEARAYAQLHLGGSL